MNKAENPYGYCDKRQQEKGGSCIGFKKADDHSLRA
jgi:hypothetical protein